MLSRAISKYIRYSPYKLRLLVNAIRGMDLRNALHWLVSNRSKRSVVINKVLMSAWANAKVKNPDLKELSDVKISLMKVDQGPAFKYTLPGAQGRSVLRRRRTCHIEVQLQRAKRNVLVLAEEDNSGS